MMITTCYWFYVLAIALGQEKSIKMAERQYDLFFFFGANLKYCKLLELGRVYQGS